MNSVFFQISQLLDYKTTIKTRKIYNTEKALAGKTFTATMKDWQKKKIKIKPDRILKDYKPHCSLCHQYKIYISRGVTRKLLHPHHWADVDIL